MARCLITSVNTAEIMLENIFRVMERETFCKDTAAKIVGGVKKLENLIAAGEIDAEKEMQRPEQQMEVQCRPSSATLPEYEKQMSLPHSSP